MKEKFKDKDRVKAEYAEEETQVKSDVSDTRFQNDQQLVKPVRESEKTDGPKSGFNYKTSDNKGSQLKQEAVAKVITGVGGEPSQASVALSGSGLKSLAYSGAEGTILGTASSTPTVDTPSRSSTRPGQKMDAVVRQIDFAASEQVVQKYDGSKPLQDNPGEVQGYLGHPENANARGQKTSEAVPGALLFQRSADELVNDQVIYSAGQTNKEQGVQYNYEPTKYVDANNDEHAFHITRGDYIPKAMRVGIRLADNEVVSLTYDVDDITPPRLSSQEMNEAAPHFIADMNLAEINRQNIEQTAGVETEANWSSLARGVQQPTPTCGFLTDDEIITGSEDAIAYRFLVKAWDYLLNKVGKDGQVPYRAFREMLYGYARTYSDAASIAAGEAPFCAIDYLNGAPSLMIALYDSISKFSKRGDLFTQPRGWKLHKQTADNCLNQFHVKPGFIDYLSSIDCFSTIDRGYDPLLPVNITDGFRVAHPYSFADLYRRNGGGLYMNSMDCPALGVSPGDVIDDIVEATYSAADENYPDQRVLPSSKVGFSIYDSDTSQWGLENIYTEKYGNLNDDSRKTTDVICTYLAPDWTDESSAKGGFNYDKASVALARAKAIVKQHLQVRGNQNVARVVVYRLKKTGFDEVHCVSYLPNIYTKATDVGTWISDITGSAPTHTLESKLSARATFTREESEIINLPSFAYSYKNRMNPYYVVVRNPLLYGIEEWVRNMAYKMVHAGTTSKDDTVASYAIDGVVWFYIPIAHYTRQMSLWDLIVCASMPFQQKVRTNSQLDTLFYEKMNGKYPWIQLKSLGECNPLSSSQFTFGGIEKPLMCGTMKPSSAIRWVAPEKFWRVKHNYSHNTIDSESFVLPYYFSEEQFTIATSDGYRSIAKNEDGHVMNYPTVRSGARWAFSDLFFSMSERDIRLCLDRLITIPRGSVTGMNPANSGVYKYSLSNSGIPLVEYTPDEDGFLLSSRDLMRTPREIGWGFTAPWGYVTPATNIVYYLDGNASCHVTGENHAYSINNPISIGSSFRMRTWRCDNGKDYQGPNARAQLTVDRAGNFAQTWREQMDAVYAPYGDDASAIEYAGFVFKPSPDLGISISASDTMSVVNGNIIASPDDALFNPFTNGALATQDGVAGIITLQKWLWSKVQLLPFALSPFDQTPYGLCVNDSLTIADATLDPYDLMYIFGFCGWKGSDYREDVYNRMYERQTLGWLFKQDPFEASSPVMKDGGFSPLS